MARRRHSVLRRGGMTALCGLLLGGLAFTSAPGVAKGDDLDDQQAAVAQQVSASNEEVTAEDQALISAQTVLASSKQQLATAQAQLAAAQSARDAAATADSAAQAALNAANDALTKANGDLAAAQAAVVAQREAVGSTVRASAQQNSELVTIGLLVGGKTSTGLSNRVQWTDQAFRAQQSKLDSLSAAELRFEAAQQKQQEAQKQADAQRQQAASALATAQQTADAAQAAEQKVQALVTQSNSDEAAAQQALAAALKKNTELKAQQAALTQQIQKRNEEQAAEAARQKAADAAAAAAAAAGTSTPSSTKSVLIDPVPGAPVTSPYGYRINPILNTKELHDGVDLGASCGAPIHASASGTVAQVIPADQSAGWGNRLVLDHGLVNGVYLATGYNHAEGYIVKVGDQVSQGQVIGYVGATGLATGCHLHFHTYVNGKAVDPQTWITVS